MANDAPIIIETGPHPAASVIWLHGLGADGHDFEPILPELALPDGFAIRFVFPHAPYRPVTINNGYVMRAWYDLAIQPHGFFQNESDIRESESYVCSLIEAECRAGRNSKKIILAGFSQGAAVVLHAGLRYAEPLGGILALSMPLPLPDKIPLERSQGNLNVPIFLAHGTQDPVVPYPVGEQARNLFQELNIPVEWHAYPMGHSVIAEEIADIRTWMLRVLGV